MGAQWQTILHSKFISMAVPYSQRFGTRRFIIAGATKFLRSFMHSLVFLLAYLLAHCWDILLILWLVHLFFAYLPICSLIYSLDHMMVCLFAYSFIPWLVYLLGRLFAPFPGRLPIHTPSIVGLLAYLFHHSFIHLLGQQHPIKKSTLLRNRNLTVLGSWTLLPSGRIYNLLLQDSIDS